jgi:DNA-binding MarR family transcriptional regulator
MKASNGTVPRFTEVGLLIKSRMQSALPLPLAQCQALWFVAERKRPGMQDVAKYFKITAPSATFLIDELVRGGYLARRANTGDRRKVELALTPKGKKEFKTLLVKRKKVLDGVFKPLSAADRTDLDRILKKIIADA